MLCLAYSHKKVYKALRKIDSRFLISISKNSVYYYAGDDALLSRLGVKIYRFFQDYLVIGMFIRHCDFLGVNYYFSNRVDKFHINNSNQLSSDLGYDMDPADIQFVLQSLYKKYHKPIFITENGLADSQDQYRQWWIEQTVAGMRVAILSGVKLIGYLHWSLLDNFEWSYGKWPRFGLVEVSYRTMKRKLRPSAIWFGEFVKKNARVKIMDSPFEKSYVKITVIGGGTGSFTLLQALKKYTKQLAAVVNMSDDGGSTGALRDELGVFTAR
jgi:hypothetical protein